VDGAGIDELERSGRMGLAGMRERIGTLGGGVRFSSGAGGGVTVAVTVPAGDGRIASGGAGA
jgi:signal transduction histidine kinase